MFKMTNPYQVPLGQAHVPNAHSLVRGPAIALMAVSIFALVCGIVGLGLDVFLVLSGAVAQMEAVNNGPVSEYTQIAIRSIWGVILLLAASFVLYGAIQMKGLTKYSVARSAAIVALIPLLGPCCILGIPFGIWALVTLGRPEVRSAFRS
jgi:hypothetical protein